MDMSDFLGKLTLDALPHNPIEMGAAIMMTFMALGAFAFLTYKKRWGWLYREYLTSLDPKKIGVMYLFVVVLMLVKGLIDAAMMRAQQALSVGDSYGYLGPDHFQQIFTAHGTLMIFFVGMGVVFTLFNLILPLQIGARDVAFPFLNAVSFWLFFVGFLLVNVSLMIGEFSGAGWVGYPPLTGIKYNPGVGVDYWIWSVQIAGVGSLLSGINFFVTIIKLRCPGMTFMRMPVFVWASIATATLIIFAFPILTVTLGLLSFDRMFGMHFFTSDFGGNPMMYVNLFWAWGHPEVYILVLPAFGVFSEIVPVYSQKRLFGYTSMIWAIGAITVLSFIVWLHHFFTMGASPNVNAFFGAMTMLIAIPTGVKIFNWLFTMFRGRVRLMTPMLWFLGFVVTFTIGGMAGVLLSIAPVDFQTHNSLFLVAHFHSVIIGGVVFGFFAGFTYWFPKFTGFKLEEKYGVYAFWCWLMGFLFAFVPLYILGFMGATRRLSHYDAETGWQPFFIAAAFGVVLVFIGMGFQILQVIQSIKHRQKNLDTTGDPWNGRTLEWSTTSPPPLYNFAVTPQVHGVDAFWDMKQEKTPQSKPNYKEIHMPKDSPIPLMIGMSLFLFGFAIIWQIIWLVGFSFLLTLTLVIKHLCYDDVEYAISPQQIQQMEGKR